MTSISSQIFGWSIWDIKKGFKVDAITSPFRSQQLIDGPAHLVAEPSFCIDLKFTLQPNLVMESRVHSSLHPDCHHQITYAKLNLKIHYTPPYEPEIWQYEKVHVDRIRIAINEFSWESQYIQYNYKNVLSNYIPHKAITCDDRDLPWVNKNIKQLMLENSQAYKFFGAISPSS